MVKEAYVSYEVAKLLKKKGFDELCIFKYNSDGIKVKAGQAIDEWSNTELEEGECSAPTHQMVMSWLRGVHNIKVNIWYSNPNYAIEYFEPNTQTRVGKFVFIGDGYPSYEEATEAALKYVLENLI